MATPAARGLYFVRMNVGEEYTRKPCCEIANNDPLIYGTRQQAGSVY